MQLNQNCGLTKLEQSIAQALPIVAAGYAERYGFTIGIGGDTAYTNYHHIQVPFIDLNKLAPVKGMKFGEKVYFGFLGHECAHGRYTDFSIKITQNTIGQLTNIIEDVRIEILFERDFPGAREDLNAINDYALLMGYFDPSGLNHPMAIAMGYLLQLLNARYLKREACLEVLESYTKLAKSTLPAGWFVRVEALLNKHWPLNSTKEAEKLSELFLHALKEAEEEQKNQQQQAQQQQSQQDSQNDQGQAEQSANSTSKDSNDENTGNGQCAGGNSEDNSTEQSGGQSQSGQGESSDSKQTSNSGGSGVSAFDDLDNADLPKTVHEIVEQSINDIAQPMKETDKIIVAKSDSFIRDGDNRFIDKAMQHSIGLRNKLLSLVQARYKGRKVSSDTGSRLRASKMATLSSGDTNIFQQKKKKVMPASAIHLLVDNSGSMGSNDKIRLASEMSAALALAFNAIKGCSIAVTAFPGNNSTSVGEVIKRGVNIRHQVKRCNLKQTGGTPLAEAMTFAFTELVKAKEERKILICITDGDVNNPQMVKYLNSHSDVLSLGFVIGFSNRFEGLFDYSVLIRNPEELQQKTFELVEKVI